MAPLRAAEAATTLLRSRRQPSCPLCGELGAPLHSGLRDRLLDRPEAWSLVRCEHTACGLLWLDPQPLSEDITLAYGDSYPSHVVLTPPPSLVRRFYSRVERGYFADAFGYDGPEVRSWQRLAGHALGGLPLRRAACDFQVAHLSALSGGRLLDVGCGRGDGLLLLRRLGWSAEGVDFDPSAVDAARTRGLEVRCGTVEAQRYAAASFDAIVLSHVIEHLFDPLQLLRECARILKPGGRLVVVTPNTASLFHARFGASWFHLDPPRHIMLFHAPPLRQVVEAAGLTIERLTTSLRSAWLNWILSRRIQREGVADLYRPPSNRERMEGYLSVLAKRIGTTDSGEELVLLARKPPPSEDDPRMEAPAQSR
ncbi:MAG: methyltransferase domain-containing protein [Luteitalea sp.]|nr:methyltransferase domain-containing protein [Luteitalea sp.]